MSPEITVLHVDDSPAFRDLTAEFLERVDETLSVRSEANPTNVVDRVTEEPIDCVVSDFDMPECTGLELCREFRAEHPELPFFLFTNNTAADTIEETIAAGATDYVIKETGVHHYTILANRIQLTVTRHRALRKLREIDADSEHPSRLTVSEKAENPAQD